MARGGAPLEKGILFPAGAMALAVLLALLFPSAAAAVVITVDAAGGAGVDATTIQAGIDMAGWGDFVSVAPATYEEFIDMKDGVTVMAAAPGVILNGTNLSDNTRALVMFVGLDRFAVLDGFEIRNFSRAGNGGGIGVENGGATIRNNTLVTNTATRGAGIYLLNSTALVDGNRLDRNCGAHGGGIYVDGGTPALINNIVDNNTCAGRGGGVYIRNASAEVTNNTINGNIASNTPWQGGGIYVECSSGSPVPLITMNMITSNNFDTGSGTGSGIYIEPACGVYSFTYNLIWGNFPSSTELGGDIDNSLLISDPTLQTGNPLYVSATADDFHITEGSPAIDGGNPFFDPAPGNTLVELNDFNVDFLDDPPNYGLDGTLRGQAGPNLDEVQNLRFPFLADPHRGQWDILAGAFLYYNIYRGTLSSLSLADFGSCETAMDGDGTSSNNEFLDTEMPPIGDGFFYLITAEEHISCSPDIGSYEVNGESSLGQSRTGQAPIPANMPVRPNLQACQLTCRDYF